MGDESPKNKVKFLCSYGGRVLPRPSDGVLKYVGGETRVICVPRGITFSEMMRKVSGMVDTGEVVLKYQLVPEDLDALVSVRTEEDLKHMIEEHDRHGSGGAALLRAFLFPSKPLLVDNNQVLQGQPPPVPVEPCLLEQRYIDAINGIIRTSPRSRLTSFSACCSPKSNSPDGHTTAESPFHHSQSHKGRVSMQRVRSSPSLSNLTTTTTTNTQPPPPPLHDHSINTHYHHPLPYPSSSSSTSSRQDPLQIGMGRPPPVITDRGFNYYYSTTTTTRPHKGGGAYAYHDDSAPYGGGHVMVERVHSVPRSPRKTMWE